MRIFRLTVLFFAFSIVAILAFAPAAQAWGRRGHSIVCQTGAYLASTDKQTTFLKSSSFDFGYYCNVPDMVWKRPETYKQEWFNHFMDMEMFDRAFRSSQIKNPFEMDRLAFNAAFPLLKDSAGRAFWRIREFESTIADLTQTLRNPGLGKEQHLEAQLKWVTMVGLMGHYVGDLSQPLHVTENYDGGLSDQKGVHHYYEDVLVDELFDTHGTNIEQIVQSEARTQWPSFHKKNKDKTTLQLLTDLAEVSTKSLPVVLKTDRKTGRLNDVKGGEAHRATLVSSLTRGALTQAELISRHLGWEFINTGHGDAFTPAPAFIPPPTVPGTQPQGIGPGAAATSPTPAPSASPH